MLYYIHQTLSLGGLKVDLGSRLIGMILTLQGMFCCDQQNGYAIRTSLRGQLETFYLSEKKQIQSVFFSSKANKCFAREKTCRIYNQTRDLGRTLFTTWLDFIKADEGKRFVCSLQNSDLNGYRENKKL